jgi:hypothetical protein
VKLLLENGAEVNAEGGNMGMHSSRASKTRRKGE